MQYRVTYCNRVANLKATVNQRFFSAKLKRGIKIELLRGIQVMVAHRPWDTPRGDIFNCKQRWGSSQLRLMTNHGEDMLRSLVNFIYAHLMQLE
jgi:hypothetical protein